MTERENGGIADKALQLVLEMKRNPDILPPYNAELVRSCLHKIDELYKLNADIVAEMRAGKQNDYSLLQPRIVAMYHIRRCLCAYINARKDRIRSFRWKYGGALPSSIRNALCEAEIEFFNEYSSTLARFQGSLGDNGVNLLLHVEPPKSLFVQVRALENYGDFETSDGTLVVLMKDSLHSLPRQDCEMLIRQGILEIAN
ncbi:unnamed protein product [Caenorhabditis angaria]|uniref:DNA replication complex GINS protein PSF1 n=1 Tax=Caenorhabditis angaria TaxID=860376 RepID=A0A9P1MZ21_9PELO|nr:unnamed protein product [Caenorhabditis angaria]